MDMIGLRDGQRHSGAGCPANSNGPLLNECAAQGRRSASYDSWNIHDSYCDDDACGPHRPRLSNKAVVPSSLASMQELKHHNKIPTCYAVQHEGAAAPFGVEWKSPDGRSSSSKVTFHLENDFN